MQVWGIGAYWNSAEDQSEFFVRNSVAALGWPEERAPSLCAMMNEMQMGDIIYIKSFTIRTKTLNIKAIGKITGYTYTDDVLFGGRKKAVPVKWLYTGGVLKYGLTEEDGINNVYSHTLYREYSPGIIRRLNNYIDF